MIIKRNELPKEGQSRVTFAWSGRCRQVGAALPYDVEATSYPSARGTLQLGGTPVVSSAAAAQAWQDVLAFLRAPG